MSNMVQVKANRARARAAEAAEIAQIAAFREVVAAAFPKGEVVESAPGFWWHPAPEPWTGTPNFI